MHCRWSAGVRTFPCSSNLNFACERTHRFPLQRPPLPPLLRSELDLAEAAVVEILGNSLEDKSSSLPVSRTTGSRCIFISGFPKDAIQEKELEQSLPSERSVFFSRFSKDPGWRKEWERLWWGVWYVICMVVDLLRGTRDEPVLRLSSVPVVRGSPQLSLLLQP